MQVIRIGLRINRSFVSAKARNIAVIGVREQLATKPPIPAKMYVVGMCPVHISNNPPQPIPMAPPRVNIGKNSPPGAPEAAANPVVMNKIIKVQIAIDIFISPFPIKYCSSPIC